MKITPTLIEKLIRLAKGETLPASTLKGDLFDQMRIEGILIATTHGSHKSFRASGEHSIRHYLESQYDIRNLEATYKLLCQDNNNRATQVNVTGYSKFVRHRTFTGFLVNSCQPISATLNGHPITILPTDGSYLFIADYQTFSIPIDVVVIGIENAENFRQIKRQMYLFEEQINNGKKLLFVSRYPQNGDLQRWLKEIQNKYIHFGDLDLAGIAIYQNEFYRHLGKRASFLIPIDYENRIANGQAELYNVQLPQYARMQAEDSRISDILSCIHRHHKGYEQEGFII